MYRSAIRHTTWLYGAREYRLSVDYSSLDQKMTISIFQLLSPPCTVSPDPMVIRVGDVVGISQVYGDFDMEAGTICTEEMLLRFLNRLTDDDANPSMKVGPEKRHIRLGQYRGTKATIFAVPGGMYYRLLP